MADRSLLELAPFDEKARLAVIRWQQALALMGPLAPAEEAALLMLPDELPEPEVLTQLHALVRKRAAALGAFALHPGESARVPPGMGPGRGLASADEWQAFAQLKLLQSRLAWWEGDRAKASAATIDLMRAGSGAAREATDLSGWVTWTGIAGLGFDGALWIARQIDAGEDELVPLSKALGAAAGPWPDGACNALRGELAYGFRGAVEHLPETRDIAGMLDALADFGPPSTPAGAAATLGEAERTLFDPAATLDRYGDMAAKFIATATAHPNWRHSFFAADIERRNELLLAELGVFGELAMNREFRVYPEDRLADLKAAVNGTDNAVGKLLVVLAAPNFDALAFTGIRAEAHRRCIRVLVEWRRRVLVGDELPAAPEAWARAGLPASEIEDPFSGQPLHFDPERLRVWSVGLDGTNNRGTGDPRAEIDGADLWWSLIPE